MVYAPGTEETDPKKQNMSLQQNAAANLTNAANIGTNTTNIATNTSNIATNTAAIAALQTGTVTTIAGNSGAFTLNSASGINNSTNDIVLSQATASQFGTVKVDNTTITATAGVISAVPPAAPAMVLLNTLTASNSATLSDTTSFALGYGQYEIVFTNLVAAAGTAGGNLVVHSGGAFQSTGYLGGQSNFSGVGMSGSNPTTFLGLSGQPTVNLATPGLSGYMLVSAPSQTSTPKQWVGQTTYNNQGNTSWGFWNSTAALTGFRFSMSTGNITSGTIKIYGIT